MIFASLGTMDMPFYRMAKLVDDFASQTEEEVVVQTGFTDFDYKYARSFKFCTKDEMRKYIEDASILIMQGGWGAISEAMERHKRIVVIPRHDGTEHIHDQFQLVNKLASLGCVVEVKDDDSLTDAVDYARSFCFKQLEKGNAERIITETLVNWFS